MPTVDCSREMRPVQVNKRPFHRRLSTTSSTTNVSTDKDRPPIDQELIEDVRQILLDAAERRPEKFDARDIQRVRSDDHFVTRFLVDKMLDNSESNAVREAAKNLEDTLLWRQDLGVNDFKASDFPRELWEANILAGRETEDDQVFTFVCCRRYKKVSGWTDLIVKFIVYNFEQMEARVARRPLRLFLDTSGIGLAQVDISLGLSGLPIWLKYYPGVIDSVTICDLPLVCRAGLYFCLKVLPDRITRKVRYTDRLGLYEEVGRNSLPGFMGGNATNIETSGELCPIDAPTVEEIGQKLQIRDESVQKFKAMLLGALDVN